MQDRRCELETYCDTQWIHDNTVWIYSFAGEVRVSLNIYRSLAAAVEGKDQWSSVVAIV
jgi:hypothetical protein